MDWRGCYLGSYDWWANDSYAHPAKMAPGLCLRILERIEKLGFLRNGETVLDMMAGIGTTAIGACLKNHKVITVELEEKFCKLQKENKARLERRLDKHLDWTIIQGDSRELNKLLAERGLCGVVSPPYGETIQKVGGEVGVRHIGVSQKNARQYSGDPNNIGNLPDKAFISIISPPYTNSHTTHHLTGLHFGKDPYETLLDIQRGRRRQKDPDKWGIGYGKSKGQIGNLPDRSLIGITSPLYGDIAAQFRNRGSKLGGDKFQYGNSAQQNIGNLADEADYEDNTKAAWWRKKAAASQQESDLEAMLKVYREAAKVCNVLVVVIKNPTRNGKLRRLDLDTKRLLEMAGFEVIEHHRAILFKEIETPTLFGGTEKKVKGRLSFFKRLSYNKGQPVARWEDVFIAVRRNPR